MDEAKDEDPDSRGLRVQLVLGTSRRLRAGSSGARNDLMSRSLRRRSGDMPRKGEPPSGLSAGETPGRGESSATSGWWRTVERDMAEGTATRDELERGTSVSLLLQAAFSDVCSLSFGHALFEARGTAG